MSDYCKFHIWKKSSNNIGKPIMKCRKCKKELKIKNLTVKMEKSNSILQNQNEPIRIHVLRAGIDQDLPTHPAHLYEIQ